MIWTAVRTPTNGTWTRGDRVEFKLWTTIVVMDFDYRYTWRYEEIVDG